MALVPLEIYDRIGDFMRITGLLDHILRWDVDTLSRYPTLRIEMLVTVGGVQLKMRKRIAVELPPTPTPAGITFLEWAAWTDSVLEQLPELVYEISEHPTAGL